MTTQTCMPKSFAAGTSVAYTRSYKNYPASDGWTLKVYLSGKTNLVVAATVNANGKDYDVSIPSSGNGGTSGLNNDTYEGLLYHLEERAEKAGPPAKSICLAKEDVWVTLDFAAAAPGVAQLQEEKELAIVNAAIQGRLDKDMQSYQFESRAVIRIPIEELYRIRKQLVAAIKAKRSRGKIATPVKSVFTSPRCR